MKIDQINVYPVKSCAGIELSEAKIQERGFAFDRSWVFVDERGSVLTQRDEPSLATIQTELTMDHLKLHAAGRPSIEIPLEISFAEICDVAIWGRTCRAIREPEGVAKWISGFLIRNASMLRFDPDYISKIDPIWAGSTGAHTGFADQLPFHITTVESLAALNDERVARGLTPTEMKRFRPNIVISGAPAWAEDYWPALTFNDFGAKLEIVRATTRCKVIETDQSCGVRDAKHGNNATLTKIGRIFTGKDGNRGSVFGVQALPSLGFQKSLVTGDKAEVSELSDKLPPLPRFTK